MKHILMILVLIACVPAYTHSQKSSIFISGGFLKGKGYLDMDITEKRAYAMGVINGMLAAPLMGAPEERVEWLVTCTRKMDDEQVAAILTKHVRDNPENWHNGMNILSWNAMRLACPKPNKDR
jgi:hypothetical protein